MATLARRSGRGRSRRKGKSQSQQSAEQTKDERQAANTKKSRGRSRSRTKKRPFDPEKHFMPPPVPKREYGPDPITGQPVDNILTAIAEPVSGAPANFDSVLHQIQEQEQLAENERVIYVGRGEFGILVEDTSNSPRYLIRKRIQIEDEYQKYDWRKELSPGISRDYKPSPEPLSDLFDEAEAVVKESGFGKAHPSIYLPKID